MRRPVSHTRPLGTLPPPLHSTCIGTNAGRSSWCPALYTVHGAGASPWIIPRFPAIYAGLTTGFCGCLTTFSSWNNAAASILLRGQVARAVACLVVGFSMASCALTLGAQASSKAAGRKGPGYPLPTGNPHRSSSPPACSGLPSRKAECTGAP